MLRNFVMAIAVAASVGSVAATNYYMSPSGSDDADGLTEATAKASLGVAKKLLRPGDTLYILPGLYCPTDADIALREEPGPYAVVYNLSMCGEPGWPITIAGVTGADGSRPVFDLSRVAPEGCRVTGFLISGRRLVLANFEVRGIRVTRTDHTQSENIRISGGAWNTLENIACHDGMGIGFYINKASHHNLVLNCDGYNNYDPVSDIDRRTGMGSGGNNDGFGCHVKGGMPGNMFVGCRAWNNTDDGFDLINCYSPVTFEYSLALSNGYDAEGVRRADGNGFKAGGFSMKPRKVALEGGKAPRHTVIHNVAIGNKANGLYANHHLGGIDFMHNSAIDNGNYNYSMVNRRGASATDNVDVDGYDHVVTGNSSVSARGRHTTWFGSTCKVDGNSWQMQGEPSASYNREALVAPRGSDGMLPAATLNEIASLRHSDKCGADFGGYVRAVAVARAASGAHAR